MNLITPNTAKFQEELKHVLIQVKKENLAAEATELAQLNKEPGSYEVRNNDNSLLNSMIGWICSLFLGQLILIYFLMRMFHK